MSIEDADNIGYGLLRTTFYRFVDPFLTLLPAGFPHCDLLLPVFTITDLLLQLYDLHTIQQVTALGLYVAGVRCPDLHPPGWLL